MAATLTSLLAQPLHHDAVVNAVKRAGLYAQTLPAQLPQPAPVENNHERN